MPVRHIPQSVQFPLCHLKVQGMCTNSSGPLFPKVQILNITLNKSWCHQYSAN